MRDLYFEKSSVDEALRTLQEQIQQFKWKIAHSPAKKQWGALEIFQEQLRDFTREYLLTDLNITDPATNRLIREICAGLEYFERWLQKMPRSRVFPSLECAVECRSLSKAIKEFRAQHRTTDNTNSPEGEVGRNDNC